MFAQNVMVTGVPSIYVLGHKYKKNRYTPVLLYIKVGFKGVNISRTCFPDAHNH